LPLVRSGVRIQMESDTGSAPKVSIVIPSIGHQPLLANLVQNLTEGTQTSVEVIVSHSGLSRPSNLEHRVLLVHQQSPLLVSAARNRGAEKARGEYLFFIDDDNDAAPGVVDVLVALLDKSPELVEVGPSMFYASDREKVFCLGASHHGKLGRTSWIVDLPTDGTREIVSEVLPNAFMVRRSEFEAIGGFDEVSFPMDFEESDLAFRLRRRHGEYLACSVDAKIWHHAPLSLRQQLAAKSLARSYYSARNRPIFVARHLGTKQWIEYVIAGQFLAAASRLLGIVFGVNKTGHSRATICVAYIAGMVVGPFLSVRELAKRI
jgi:GT2 family glycosyltransferase